jgi:hypothetical protein
MSEHDLFGHFDDTVTEAARLLAQHDIIAVPGALMRQCLTVLNILACDAESSEEADSYEALIKHIEASMERVTTSASTTNLP